ncbi:predicted protein [Chaetomium globosum CBS 148.51]|uniref:BTB domain-containing protein n=1 Tax=Chaetomium globosum (strain ATCC 6205 / CBS 148.51 / DSM 1962 / NBRC 6347 / NRRL 1970) TaxID=306901 RepID=Q2GM26_CHAGB|nr:uncharacterized protein CHGG_10978 [Chaetomium globosum CBS 148.51]EAQ83160.1 predicted protein [Chaetomium globosum CBS 148.51]
MPPKAFDMTTLDEVLAAYGAVASTATRATSTTEAPPMEDMESVVLDKQGRLFIDVVGADREAPHHKRTYRHRVSLEAMARASPKWKETIFGPEGQRQQPTDEEKWIIQLPDDEPLPITILLALIHEQPKWVPRWHDDTDDTDLDTDTDTDTETDTAGVCTQIAKTVATADKYGVLPLLRPFVRDWLAHARPRFKAHTQGDGRVLKSLDPNAVHRLEVAWQLGAVKLVKEHISRIALASGSKLDVLGQLPTEANDAVGILASFPELRSVVAKCRSAAVEQILAFFHGLFADLRGEKGNCKVDEDETDLVFEEAEERAACDMWILEYISKRREALEKLIGEIPEEAKNYHGSTHRLLNTIGHVLGVRCAGGPKRIPWHECVETLYEDYEDLAEELILRWKGSESVLEPNKLEWLERRRDILAADGCSS